MPIIKRFHNCQIRIYIGDHLPPHFHIVLNDGRDCLVEIETLAVLAGKLPRRAIAPALTWAADNRAALRAKWKEFNP